MSNTRKIILFFILLNQPIIIGCSMSGIPEIAVDDKTREAIQSYLDNKVMPPSSSFNGKVLSAYAILGTDKDKIYVYALLQEYYQESGKIMRGSGSSNAFVLKATKSNNEIVITGHKSPGIVSYSEDMSTLFPKKLQKVIHKYSASGKVKYLEEKAMERAVDWFKKA